MRLRPRFDHWLPRRLGVSGIVLYPYVLFSMPREEAAPELLQHEMIHVRQVRAEGWLRFYSRYLIEYVTQRLRGRSHATAYLAISYEAEAYLGQGRTPLTQAENSELGVNQGVG